jgi:hypothetical protein
MPDRPVPPSGYLGITRRPSPANGIAPTVDIVKVGRIAYAGAGLYAVNGLGAAVEKVVGG